jgi:hypothetical protein
LQEGICRFKNITREYINQPLEGGFIVKSEKYEACIELVRNQKAEDEYVSFHKI